MKQVLWAIVFASCLAAASVFAAEPGAARVAPAEKFRIPTSQTAAAEPSAPAVLDFDKELAGTSIEIGFSQDGEPEPHLLVLADGGEVRIFELPEHLESEQLKVARKPSAPLEGAPSKVLPTETYAKRFRQIVDTERFFSAKQARPKAGCKDRYVLRIKRGEKFRERRGCSNQGSDTFAGFAQNMYREAFLVWNKAK